MTWAQVARKDFEDAVRSKMLWAIMAAFIAFMIFVVAAALARSDPSDASASIALRLTAQLGQLFVPLLALIAGYMAIVGERRSGSLRMLLGYPHSRRDVVLGKLLGRSATIAVTLGIGSIVSILVVAALVKSPDLGDIAGMLGAIVLFGMAFTGIAVGVSSAVKTRGKAMALSIGAVLVFLVVWDGAAAGIYVAVTGSLPGLHPEPWYFLLERLSPISAFRAVGETFVDGQIYPMFQMGLEDIPADTPMAQRAVSNRVEGPLPFYLKNSFAAVLLALWGLIPAIVGYVRFERSDL